MSAEERGAARGTSRDDAGRVRVILGDGGALWGKRVLPGAGLLELIVWWRWVGGWKLERGDQVCVFVCVCVCFCVFLSGCVCV